MDIYMKLLLTSGLVCLGSFIIMKSFFETIDDTLFEALLVVVLILFIFSGFATFVLGILNIWK